MSGTEPVAAQRELLGTVDRIVFHNAETGWTVLRLTTDGGDTVILVGTGLALQEGDAIKALGAFEDDPSWGRRFRAAVVHAAAPSTREGMITFLGSGRIKGLGPVLAHRLVRVFGDRLADVIEQRPQELAAVEGVGSMLAERIAETWRSLAGERDAILFLNSHGLGGAKAARILKAYGPRTVSQLAANPWSLARDVNGIGFMTADRFALAMGRPHEDPDRVAAALRHVLEEIAQGQGDTQARRAFLRGRLIALLDVSEDLADQGIARALEAGHVVRHGGDVLALEELHRAEQAIAERLAALAHGIPSWRTGDAEAVVASAAKHLQLDLAGSQAVAVQTALVSRLMVVTGGPGTGKTTIVRAILAAVERCGGRVVLAAPTGRAARRLSESTGHEASTIHRLLEAEPGHGFRRDADRPLEGDLFVIDEASMVDTELMAALVDALPDHAALLMVGDVDQLPSVGPGRILGDLIECGYITVVRLVEIFRQAAESKIVANAHRIVNGQPPETSRGEGLGDFYAIRASGPDEFRQKLRQLLIERIPRAFHMDPVEDVQILVPTNRGAVGTIELNRFLQALLNPEPAGVLQRGEQRFAVGDRIMQIENDYEREVSNGDVGRVVSVDSERSVLQAAFDDRLLTYEGSDLEALTPAYAVTVHKAQGSEYPAVVVLLSREHGRMLRRDLLYTAVTRARRLVVLLGEPEAIGRAVENADTRHRQTGLIARIEEAFQEYPSS
ncbi:MAG TPA: ATP-dependent RecD-like DNA helicase [Geminicoccus sp.]|jgi:exodeoxyribonuclease V alpha subunit|uniref:SF1B family DNA helicase RecD2 n=1 Tax=Geminicoccus sp. TaxID=2024832 RepID=UPI002E327016|nr:ATP-dependent RecD-like DNA helicase [Geminicoccus sp.]HEX2527295.1 ATP-dependent RecD-like DNA helicase [Geminicoccus sp.]